MVCVCQNISHAFAKCRRHTFADTSRNEGPPLYHYGRNITERDTRAVAPYATTTTATYAVTPINIDQAQQWPAGKRIDILYFPPGTDWLPRRTLVCYSNCDTGTNCRIRCPHRDSTHDEMLMDENDTAARFMTGCDRRCVRNIV